MTRRGHGEGSIYLRSDGRWAASISVEGGKRKTFYGKTRKEVQEQLKTALHHQQQGMLASGPQQTVKQFLAQWLEDHKHSIRVRSYDDNGRGAPARGVTVTLGRARAVTGRDGSAVLVVAGRGRPLLRAARHGAIPAFPARVAVA